MERERYSFASDYQDLILSCIVAHPEKFMGYAGILNADFFSGSQRGIAARSIFQHWTKYGHFPAWETLGQLIFDAIAEREKDEDTEQALLYVKKLQEIETHDVDYVVSKVVDFARESATLNAVNRAYDMLAKGKIPPGGFAPMFDEALKIGANMGDIGYVIHEDAEAIVKKVTKKGYGLRSGYPLLDKIWPTGWGPGWLIVPLAPPKRYKTAFCINLALNMVGPSINEPVFYYPCEITQELAAIRILCNIAGLTTDDLFSDPEGFLRAALNAMIDRISSPLIVKGFPSKVATLGTIREHAKMCKTHFGIHPKALIIDYAETVLSSQSTTKGISDWKLQASVYTEARAIGAELGCTIIMPDRCTAETVGKAVPNMKSFQGAFEKAGIVDAAIGLCADDTEYLENMVRYFIFLNRHGAAYQHFRGRVDPTKMRMTMDEKITYTPDEEDDGKTRKYRKGGKSKPKAVPAELTE